MFALTPKTSTVSKAIKYAPRAAPKVDHLPLMRPEDYAHDPLLGVFAHAVSLRRDHGSRTEARFVSWLVNRLPVSMIDASGNVHVDLRRLPSHRTLFTAHTDTVHHGGGANKVRIDGSIWRADGAALGADDAAGIALLCWLIHHNIPGYYIFFRGEERGGVGSSWLADHMPELLDEFDHAIAFDRAGYHDVITHQAGGRCCSDGFAQALADQLTLADFSMAYMPCDTGVYTDTAEFITMIPECTNLSVGYASQHGEWEEQDVGFLRELAKRLLTVDWFNLPVYRDPRERAFGKRKDHDTFVEYYASYYSAADDAEDDDVAPIVALLEKLRANPMDLATLYEIAEAVDDENATLIVNSVNPRRIDDDLIDETTALLHQGWDPIGVLQDFVDAITR